MNQVRSHSLAHLAWPNPLKKITKYKKTTHLTIINIWFDLFLNSHIAYLGEYHCTAPIMSFEFAKNTEHSMVSEKSICHGSNAASKDARLENLQHNVTT